MDIQWMYDFLKFIIFQQFGVKAAGTPIRIEAWDLDDGFEFGDDLLGETSTKMMPCSIFSQNYQDHEVHNASIYIIHNII